MVKKQHVKANVSKFPTLLPGLESVGKGTRVVCIKINTNNANKAPWTCDSVSVNRPNTPIATTTTLRVAMIVSQ